jgi:hypothetical protein
MSIENLSTYSKSDNGGYLTTTATRVTYTAVPRNATCTLYSNKGSGYFSGNFTHYITIDLTATTASCWAVPDMLSDYQADWYVIVTGNHNGLAVELTGNNTSSYYLTAGETTSGNHYDPGGHLLSNNTVYYLKTKRDMSVGTYGTYYIYTYSDAARTNLLDTETLTLHSIKTYQYCYAFSGWNSSTSADTVSGYHEIYDLRKSNGSFFNV